RTRDRPGDGGGGSPRRRLRGGTAAGGLAEPGAAPRLRTGAAPAPGQRATMTPLGCGPAGWRRGAARLAALLCVLAGLAVGGLAAPVDAWRTGRPSVPALPLVPGGPPAALAPRLWIDSDAACGAGRRTDSDD